MTGRGSPADLDANGWSGRGAPNTAVMDWVCNWKLACFSMAWFFLVPVCEGFPRPAGLADLMPYMWPVQLWGFPPSLRSRSREPDCGWSNTAPEEKRPTHAGPALGFSVCVGANPRSGINPGSIANQMSQAIPAAESEWGSCWPVTLKRDVTISHGWGGVE